MKKFINFSTFVVSMVSVTCLNAGFGRAKSPVDIKLYNPVSDHVGMRRSSSAVSFAPEVQECFHNKAYLRKKQSDCQSKLGSSSFFSYLPPNVSTDTLDEDEKVDNKPHYLGDYLSSPTSPTAD